VKVIGVLDVRSGLAVHARAGQRAGYRPVESVAGLRLAPGDAMGVARAYAGRLGVSELYVADLDAILGGTPQDVAVAGIAALGKPLWLDAAVSTVAQARRVLSLGATRCVVGLETLSSFGALDDICAAVGGERVAFSLDLRNGEPLATGGLPPGASPPALAIRAAAAGVGSIILIDLARVGTAAGLDFVLIAAVRQAVPPLALLAGGGVRSVDDLVALAEAGCDGALVASALHDGRIGAAGVAEAERITHPRLTR
jgi:HisA/HisF family protein